MVSTLTSGGLAKESIEEINTSFGFQEKLIGGDLDTTNIWTETTGGTGAKTILATGFIRLATGGNLGSIIAEELKQMMPLNALLIGADKTVQKFSIEFVMKLQNFGNLDDTACFFGMIRDIGSTRASNEIAGFALSAANKITALTDTGGAEEVTDITTPSGTSIDLANTYKMEYDGSAYYFYINNVLYATHQTTIPPYLNYFTLYVKSDVAAEGRCEFALLRAWFLG